MSDQQERPTLAYSGLTGTTYVLLRNGQKRAVPEAEVVTVIGAFLNGHHLAVTQPDGTTVRYGVLGDDRPMSDHQEMGVPAVIDADHLDRQRLWSHRTFGPGSRLLGVLDHIRKELGEVESDPTDLGEWVDVLILAFDGAWRAGWEPQQIIDAIKTKQARNEARTWPDWRTADPDKAIEHDRSVNAGEAQA